MENLSLLIFSVGYVALAWRRLDWAVMFILATLPSYMIRFEIFGIPFTVLETMILIAFTVWTIKNYSSIINNLKLRFKNSFKIACTRLTGENYKLKILTRYPFDYEIIALLIISWIAIVVAGFSDSALGIWKAYFFEPVLLYILLINLFGKRDTNPRININPPIANNVNSVNSIIVALAIGAFWVSALAIIERLIGWNAVAAFWPRVTGPFLYPNALGLYLGPIVLLLIGWLINQWRIFNFQYLIFKQFSIFNFQLLFTGVTILFSITAIILASSEGALAGILIAGFILGLFILINRKPKFKWLPLGAIVAVGGFVIFSSLFFLFVVPEHKYFNSSCPTLNYISDKAMLKDISGEIRKQQWRETFAMMKGDYRWLTGTGLSGYQAAIKSYHQEGIFFNFLRDKDFRQQIVWGSEEYKAKHWQPVEIYMYPHNLILNFWTELGMLGMILFIWIIGKFFYLGFVNCKLKIACTRLAGENFGDKRNGYLILGLMCSMVVIVIHGTVDVPYFKNDLAIIFWVLISMIGIMRLEIKEDNKNS
ncbi:O-antigen ligase family protein [Candidatus Parcubacteria bacterium]|nr:O-antigen ligase family protein [Candidatus Parcubacteria bacterium]